MVDGCMVWIDHGWHEVKMAVLLTSSSVTAASPRWNVTLERAVACTRGDDMERVEIIGKAVEGWMAPDGHGGIKTRDRIVFTSDSSMWLRTMVDAYLPGAFVILELVSSGRASVGGGQSVEFCG